MRRCIAAIVIAAALVGGSLPGQAAAPKRSTVTWEDDLRWSCPGHDIREHVVRTYSSIRFPREADGTRREIIHARWRGWMRDRDTGALVRDNGNWTETWTFKGRHLVGVVFTGQLWKVTIPGHGIILQQMGRQIYDEEFEVVFASAKAEAVHTRTLCRYL